MALRRIRAQILTLGQWPTWQMKSEEKRSFTVD